MHSYPGGGGQQWQKTCHLRPSVWSWIVDLGGRDLLRLKGLDWTLYLEFSKVEQTRQLEGAPLVEVDPRTKEVERECGRH